MKDQVITMCTCTGAVGGSISLLLVTKGGQLKYVVHSIDTELTMLYTVHISSTRVELIRVHG